MEEGSMGIMCNSDFTIWVLDVNCDVFSYAEKIFSVAVLNRGYMR